jgi:hypothetical protein
VYLQEPTPRRRRRRVCIYDLSAGAGGGGGDPAAVGGKGRATDGKEDGRGGGEETGLVEIGVRGREIEGRKREIY